MVTPIVDILSVSRFQEKEKRGEMITINDNINENINDKTKYVRTRENDNIKMI